MPIHTMTGGAGAREKKDRSFLFGCQQVIMPTVNIVHSDDIRQQFSSVH